MIYFLARENAIEYFISQINLVGYNEVNRLKKDKSKSNGEFI